MIPRYKESSPFVSFCFAFVFFPTKYIYTHATELKEQGHRIEGQKNASFPFMYDK